MRRECTKPRPARSARGVALGLAVGFLIAAPLAAQEYHPPSFALNVVPSVVLGLGEYQGREVSLFGVSADLSGLKNLSGPLLAGGRLGISRHGFRNVSPGFTTLSLLGSAGVFFSETPSLAFVGELAAGVRIGFSDATGLDAGLGLLTELGVDSAFGDLLRIGIRGGYHYWLGHYHGITLALTGSLAFGTREDAEEDRRPATRTQPDLVEGQQGDSDGDEPGDDGEAEVADSDEQDEAAAQTVARRSDDNVAVTALELDRVFPVFYKYYNGNPVGTIEIRNESRRTIRDIEVRFNVPGYMNAPRVVEGPEELLPTRQAAIPFTALFADSIMNVTTATVATAEISVTYTADGERMTLSFNETLDIADRNAMTWDDDRKAAAFVTPNDPALQIVARGAASVVSESGYGLVNEPLRYAMGVYEALRAYGLQYVVDPNTPFVEYSAREEAIDYLQFPGQTIQVRGGDCDDLSICYAAALHAIGKNAAFVTVPGHILAAVDTGLTPQEARREFSRVEDIIIQDEKAWIPVEMTILSEGFLRAWDQGAKQWREYDARDEARLYPISAAAEIYVPTGLRDDYYRPTPADTEEVSRAYRSQMNRYIDREILPQVARLQDQITRSDNDPRYINRLGVLYARYSLNDRAQVQFELILEQEPRHVGALVNVGNLNFLQSRFELALEHYERARSVAPDNPAALLGVARANHELENYGSASRAYEQLKERDPALADRFAYLDFRGEDAARAAAMSRVTDVVIWEE